MNIEIHRGNQIGGCVTQISSETTKILIDFGADLPGNKQTLPFDGEKLLQGVDAIFFTHSHGDHVGMFDMVAQYAPAVPMYIGGASKDILFTLYQELAKKKVIGKEEMLPIIEAFKTFRFKDKIIIGDICVTPFLVDHSAYDAYMFLIESNGHRLLHTGDFRTHGYRGKGVIPTLAKYVGKVDTLICEGTMLSRETEQVKTEKELQMEMANLHYKNVFLFCSSTNFDRIASFYQSRGRRVFLCDSFQKKMLGVVKTYSGMYTDLYTLDKVSTFQNSQSHLLQVWMEEQGCFALIRNNKESKEFLEKYYDPQNSIILYAQWKGYLDEKNPAYQKGYADLLKNRNYQYLHTTGHATKEAICQVIETVRPHKVYGIHTENEAWFQEMQSKFNFVLGDHSPQE